MHLFHCQIQQVLVDQELPGTYDVWGETFFGGSVAAVTRKHHSNACVTRACESFLRQVTMTYLAYRSEHFAL